MTLASNQVALNAEHDEIRAEAQVALRLLASQPKRDWETFFFASLKTFNEMDRTGRGVPFMDAGLAYAKMILAWRDRALANERKAEIPDEVF